MAEYSFPVEEEPLPAEQWSSVTKGIGNGIIDQGGFPYRLIFDSNANATNQGILRCPTLEDHQYGQSILEGFYHKYDADITLDFPAVTTSTRYYVVLQFVPVRATEGGLPVKVEVVKSLDYTQGKNYLHLYNVDRQPNQLLTDATVRMIRPRVAPTMIFASESDMPRADKSLWGTLAVVHNGRNSNRTKIFLGMNTNASGEDSEDSWWWKPIYEQNVPVWIDLALPSYRVWAGHGQRPQMLIDGNRRELRGRISPTSGQFAPITSGTTAYTMLMLPAGHTPPGTVGGTGQVAGWASPGFARVEIFSSGTVSAGPSKATDWIGLDGIVWYVS